MALASNGEDTTTEAANSPIPISNNRLFVVLAAVEVREKQGEGEEEDAEGLKVRDDDLGMQVVCKDCNFGAIMVNGESDTAISLSLSLSPTVNLVLFYFLLLSSSCGLYLDWITPASSRYCSTGSGLTLQNI